MFCPLARERIFVCSTERNFLRLTNGTNGARFRSHLGLGFREARSVHSSLDPWAEHGAPGGDHRWSLRCCHRRHRGASSRARRPETWWGFHPQNMKRTTGVRTKEKSGWTRKAAFKVTQVKLYHRVGVKLQRFGGYHGDL